MSKRKIQNKRTVCGRLAVRLTAAAGILPALFLFVIISASGCGAKEEFFPAGSEISESAEAADAAAEVAAEAAEAAEEPKDGRADTAEAPDARETAEPEMLCVYICGAVASPGVYSFPEGARVCDAVEAAGGLAEDAETRAVNQAAYLADGWQIVIPTKDEAAGAVRFASALPLDPSDGAAVTGGCPSDGTGSGEKIDLNTADAALLMTLPGIGEARAAAIVEYRERCGPFGAPGDIRKVAGIGDGIYEKIRERITAE